MKEIILGICGENDLQFISVEVVHGGDINRSFKIKTSEGPYFIKLNDSLLYPGMLETEAKGLHLLEKAGAFTLPNVIAAASFENYQYLLLEWIEPGKPQTGFWENFGESLASLHSQTRKSFGLEFDNYIGSLPQQNHDAKSFATFYTGHRVMPLVQVLMERGDYNHRQFELFQNFCKRLQDLVPDEPPALLHGDLWAGNYLVHQNGHPVLIDPATYFGHREMDIAMTRLFGGFDKSMYEVYNHWYPLQKDWEQRISIMQLYPLLVHAVLFGGGYVHRCVEIVLRYTK